MLNAGTKEAMDAMIEFLTTLTRKISTQKMAIDSPIDSKSSSIQMRRATRSSLLRSASHPQIFYI